MHLKEKNEKWDHNTQAKNIIKTTQKHNMKKIKKMFL